MNYYNPYFYGMPANTFNTIERQGLIKSLFKNFNYQNFLNTTQKTLNVVNQTIPLIKQTTPIIKNAKTMFRVLNEFKKIDNTNSIKKEPSKIYNEGPNFFI